MSPSPPTPRRAVAAWLQRPVDEYLRGLGVDPLPVTVQRPARREHGDLAVNLAMQLAKRVGRPPLDIAKEIAAAVPIGGPVAAVEAVPPGFVNIRVDPSWMFERLSDVVDAGEDWGRLDFGGGEIAQVEFVSTNPTGPLLFSHGRGAVVGDVVARLLGYTGHEVQREFYVNDAGRQVQLMGESILARRLGDAVPEGGYQGEYIEEYALASQAAVPDDELQALLTGGRRDEAVERLVEWALGHVVEGFRHDLDAIGVDFDRWFSERSLYDDWEQETLALLEGKGAVSRHDGAVWLRLGDDSEEVLYKSNGDHTYLMSDILYHRDKLVRRDFKRAIDIWGADHQNEVRRTKLAMELIGVDPERLVIIIFQWVRMKGEEGFIKISKRAGNVILLSDLVEEVGADAVRYHYLLRSADAPMDFDVDLARRQTNENPVFYAQMAHARLCSIRAVAEESGLEPSANALGRLGAESELAVVRELLEFPDLVEEAARSLEPHHLPHYAQRFADRIHTFYHAGSKDASLRVVGEDPELAGARLYLCEAARHTMANALRLMGVTAPTRM
jgi:arginyl-tRNA synthetase